MTSSFKVDPAKIQLHRHTKFHHPRSNTSWDMNFCLVTFGPVTFCQVTDGKRCIWAHCAWAQVGSKIKSRNWYFYSMNVWVAMGWHTHIYHYTEDISFFLLDHNHSQANANYMSSNSIGHGLRVLSGTFCTTGNCFFCTHITIYVLQVLWTYGIFSDMQGHHLWMLYQEIHQIKVRAIHLQKNVVKMALFLFCVRTTVEPRLLDTPLLWTPCSCGHFS